jgi:hypothetical protein
MQRALRPLLRLAVASALAGTVAVLAANTWPLVKDRVVRREVVRRVKGKVSDKVSIVHATIKSLITLDILRAQVSTRSIYPAFAVCLSPEKSTNRVGECTQQNNPPSDVCH